MCVCSGSNDKSLRMWALGALSVDDELAPPCSPFDHFGVGDLEVLVSTSFCIFFS